MKIFSDLKAGDILVVDSGMFDEAGDDGGLEAFSQDLYAARPDLAGQVLIIAVPDANVDRLTRAELEDIVLRLPSPPVPC